MLMELARREKIAGIKPDEDLDLFMKVCDTSCILYLLSSFFFEQLASFLNARNILNDTRLTRCKLLYFSL